MEQHVLGWALENIVPLRLLPERPHWLYVPYEWAMLDPEGTIAYLAEHLDLPDRDRMKKQVRVASRSTRKSHSTYDPAGEAQARLRAWRQHVSEEDERAAMRILDVFEIDLYRTGEDMPKMTREA